MSMMNVYAVDLVTILKWNGNDQWGEPESGSLVDVKGYVEWKSKLVSNRRGGQGGVQTPEEVMSSVIVHLDKRRVVNALGRGLMLEDRLIIDQGGVEEFYSGFPYESLSRAIIEIRQPKDFSHPHYEVYLA